MKPIVQITMTGMNTEAQLITALQGHQILDITGIVKPTACKYFVKRMGSLFYFYNVKYLFQIYISNDLSYTYLQILQNKRLAWSGYYI